MSLPLRVAFKVAHSSSPGQQVSPGIHRHLLSAPRANCRSCSGFAATMVDKLARTSVLRRWLCLPFIIIGTNYLLKQAFRPLLYSFAHNRILQTSASTLLWTSRGADKTLRDDAMWRFAVPCRCLSARLIISLTSSLNVPIPISRKDLNVMSEIFKSFGYCWTEFNERRWLRRTSPTERNTLRRGVWVISSRLIIYAPQRKVKYNPKDA